MTMRCARTMAVCVASVCTIGVSSARVAAQSVAIVPQIIVIDARSRTGALTLLNQSESPAEVSFSTMYGYTVTDDAGAMTLRTLETVSDTTPSAASWIQVFPRRLRLEPGARRTIRILVAPPETVPDREYWARLVVSVKGGRVTVPTTNGANPNIRVGLDVEVRSVLPFFFRKGTVRTSVSMERPRAIVAHDSAVVRARFTRTGNAAYIGMLTATLVDGRGRSVAKNAVPFSVYYSLDPRVPVSIAGLPKGTYRVLLEADTKRPDVDRKVLVPGSAVRGETTVVVP